MKTIHKHFETVVITAYIAKQEITIHSKTGEKYHGMVQENMTEKGFSLDKNFIFWNEIATIELTTEYFQFWHNMMKVSL
ncbi:hypothetical protein A5844_001443 [Enterococcus sp. 10A9_DIV0425]|uniref:Uncharacterized protein n=1 Tax=Candidatus Enterococcus wittei TaxID=1987383 RepID=A0A242K0X6_9ENTE|nr:hypothetical protein [Enterococcus sp. 10A9_DIV0425]OTP11308.1 hypothetical protein A5844_001443 [Enterococcus sp. 10A9_DIV0425]THE13735.1 hypothetical protein E1H99_05760 [Enterococcus hirae]